MTPDTLRAGVGALAPPPSPGTRDALAQSASGAAAIASRSARE